MPGAEGRQHLAVRPSPASLLHLVTVGTPWGCFPPLPMGTLPTGVSGTEWHPPKFVVGF